MIELNDSLIVGKGSERLVYQHPDDPNLCIKVRYRVKRSRDESARELDYAQAFESVRKAVPIALPTEWVETSEGKGLVCPLIRDSDGKLSPLARDVSDRESVVHLFDRLESEFKKFAISVTDLRAHNLVLQTNNNEQRLVLIDGFGFTNDFLKFVFKLTPRVTLWQTQRRFEQMKSRYIGNGSAK